MSIFKWVVITALAVAFLLLSVANWTPVPFHRPDGVVVMVQLPVIIAISFAAGWLPTWLWHLGRSAGLHRRLAKAERGAMVMTSGVHPHPATPSQGQPTIVPPAGA
jgi:uncharacterized integral membrane protein